MDAKKPFDLFVKHSQ